jgi:hypothetical protein
MIFHCESLQSKFGQCQVLIIFCLTGLIQFGRYHRRPFHLRLGRVLAGCQTLPSEKFVKKNENCEEIDSSLAVKGAHFVKFFLCERMRSRMSAGIQEFYGREKELIFGDDGCYQFNLVIKLFYPIFFGAMGFKCSEANGSKHCSRILISDSFSSTVP